MELDIEKNKREFISIYKNYIKREGADELLEYLEKTDFFTAPASQRYHLCCAGGLCQHSINVFNRLAEEVFHEFGNFDTISEESIAICGLLHDVCKVDFYSVEYRNVKENNEWVKKPVYVVDEKLPYGHGEKSVYIINGFMRLSREEALAINWHMGGFDARVKGGSFAMGEWFYKSPLAVLIHLADMKATYLDEHSKNYEKKD